MRSLLKGQCHETVNPHQFFGKNYMNSYVPLIFMQKHF